MSKEIFFGEVPGVTEGENLKDRKEIMEKGLHRTLQAGIDGNKNEGASVIVLSGGYEDDFDEEDEIVYTGAGGNKDGKQVEDQSWDNTYNAGLLLSMNRGLPVRVIRGSKHKSEFSPTSGYSYAGLYNIIQAWEEKGKSGFKICRFKLVYIGGNKNRKTPYDIELDYTQKDKKRVESTIMRIVRDTRISRDVKATYDYECQVCGFTIESKKARYAEGAHIKPLGKPHNGEDTPDNLLCLCPNHHVMFDKGVFSINDDFSLIGDVEGQLKVSDNHKIDIKNLFYHRETHGYN